MSRTPGILENWWVACCRKWWGSTWFWYLLSQNGCSLPTSSTALLSP